MTDKLKMKRERGANFSADEVSTLVSIISVNKEVIECKKTDAATWRAKDKAWDNLTTIFNSCSATFRTKKALRTKYEDIKKSIRKKNAYNIIERYKTGDEVPALQELTSTEEIIAEIIGSTVDGQPSVWDSDNKPRSKKMCTVEDDYVDDVDNEDQKMQDELELLNKFESIVYVEDSASQEETYEDIETNLNQEMTRKGVLKRPTTQEVIRPMKKMKSSRETAQRDNCEAKKKEEELHKMRLEILHQEFKVNEARLVAAQLDVEIKEIQKKIEMARLRKVLKQ